MPKLVYHDSDGVDKTLPLGDEPVLIGRASECAIQTHDAMVSRKHARITWDGSYWIEDLGSSNGVFLGTEKVQRAAFRPGDVVTCGSLVVRMLPDTRRTPPVEVASPVRPIGAVESARPAKKSATSNAQQLTIELHQEVERRERAEAALLAAEEKAAGAEMAAREIIQLRHRLERAEARGSELDRAAAAEAIAVFNDALAELKTTLRGASDEAELLSAPAHSVRVVRDSIKNALDELELARERLREMTRMLGLR